ncbi:MAG: hypothetical protein ABI579_06305 [Candidatus Sumerlaeota bacterium]
MEAIWNDLSQRKRQGKLSKVEEKFFKKLVEALGYLQENPRHTGLASHEIAGLSQKYDMKVFQSYLENDTSTAGRLFGRMVLSKETSQSWRLNPIRKLRNATPISASNCPLSPRPNRVVRKTGGSWASVPPCHREIGAFSLNFPLAKRPAQGVFYPPAAMGGFYPLSAAHPTRIPMMPMVPVMMTVMGVRATDAAEKNHAEETACLVLP